MMMKYLITGAIGNVGSKVVELLIGSGIKPRIFVRNGHKAMLQFGDRVEVFEGDLADSEALKAALDDVDEFFLLNSGPQIPVRDEAAAKAAQAAGVKHLVKLSSMDVRQGLAIGAWLSRARQPSAPAEFRSRSCSRQASWRTCLPGRPRSRPRASCAHPRATGGGPSFIPTISRQLR